MPASRLPHRSVGTGVAPGTCGELAQGILPGGRPFHVTCPIELEVVTRVSLRPARATTVTGLTRAEWKTRRAILLAAAELGLGPVELDVSTISALPTAKGMASSTADVVAAVRAVAAAAGGTLDDGTVARLAASIEPTDGVMYPGVATVDQTTGERLATWDWWPAFTVAMFVPSASRETAATAFPGQDRLAREYADLLERLEEASRARDASAFAAQATRSAELNEAFVRNPLLPLLRDAAAEAGALGVCVGHSGTVAGLLFDQGRTEAATAAVEVLLPRAGAATTGRVVRVPGPSDARVATVSAAKANGAGDAGGEADAASSTGASSHAARRSGEAEVSSPSVSASTDPTTGS